MTRENHNVPLSLCNLGFGGGIAQKNQGTEIHTKQRLPAQDRCRPRGLSTTVQPGQRKRLLDGGAIDEFSGISVSTRGVQTSRLGL
jgi:hypothetical protein